MHLIALRPERTGGQRRKGEQRRRKEDRIEGVWRFDKMVTEEDTLLDSILPSKGLFHSILLGHTHQRVPDCSGACGRVLRVWRKCKLKRVEMATLLCEREKDGKGDTAFIM